MRHLISYNESKSAEINQTLEDICVDIRDEGFNVIIEGVQKYTDTSYAKVTIAKRGKKEINFKGSEVAPTIERLYHFMKQNGWSMWIDAHLYTDYHYNNGYLSFKHLLPKRLEEYFNIFRYGLEKGNGDGAIKSIKIQFEKWGS